MKPSLKSLKEKFNSVSFMLGVVGPSACTATTLLMYTTSSSPTTHFPLVANAIVCSIFIAAAGVIKKREKKEIVWARPVKPAPDKPVQ